MDGCDPSQSFLRFFTQPRRLLPVKRKRAPEHHRLLSFTGGDPVAFVLDEFEDGGTLMWSFD